MKINLLTSVLLSVFLFTGNLSAQITIKNPSGSGYGGGKNSRQAASTLSTITKVWGYLEQPNYTRMEYGASPGIRNLGPSVNAIGGEADSYLEIVTGSDEYANFFPELNSDAYGIWRCFDALGNIEWAVDTKSDEARTSVAIADINNDLNSEIATGTTSGWCVEVMNKSGSWTPNVPDAAWTFPYEPLRNGSFMWHSSPAVGELISGTNHEGLEVVDGNNPLGSIWAFDGDNTDGIDDGIAADLTSWGYPGPTGIEGVDWDVLWVFQTNGSIIASPSIGDVDGDGSNEVVCGSKDNLLYCINGATGSLKWSFTTGFMITSSAALADFDNNGKMEVVVGSQDGSVYFIKGDLNNNGEIDPNEVTSFVTGGPVLSSPSIADVNNDGQLEVIIGSDDFNVYCLHYSPVSNSATLLWSYLTGSYVESSPAIANSGRTNLTIYIGSSDSVLYILSGTGSLLSSYKTNGPIITSPAAADIDGDNKLEVAFTTWSAPDEFIVLRDDGSNVNAFSEPWPMFCHDTRHTGLYDWAPPTLPTDVGVIDILEPLYTIMDGTVITPRAEVYNFGTNIATGITVTFEIRDDANQLVYSATIPVSSLASHTSILISFPTLIAIDGHYHTKAYTALDGDLNNDNNLEDGTFQVILPHWTEDFESGDGGFTMNPANGWGWGIPLSGPLAAHSGINVWATNLNGDYDNMANWILDSPGYTAMQDYPVLAFWHWYDIEDHRDGGNLKISLDGVNWTLLSPVDGYPGIATWNNFGIPDQPCYNEVSEGWLLTSFILPVLSGQQFWVRWHLGSDNITTRPGWYIDDLMGEGFQPSAMVSSTIDLKVFLQGLYNPVTFEMNKAQDESGDRFPETIADLIQIQLAAFTSPYDVQFSEENVELNQDGTCSVTVPLTGLYYLVVKHRNSIETWSSVPVLLLQNNTVFYDFTTTGTQAYGENMQQISNTWVLYGGDVNQDGLVDSGDMIPVDNLSFNFGTGYLPEDVNGDGLVDSGDMILVDNNSYRFIGKITP